MMPLLNSSHSGSSRTVVLGVVLFTLAWPSLSISRTWYVKIDGTGDAPSIQAGVDSTVAGDVVLVGAGTYQIDRFIRMKNGISVKSESGAYLTKITPLPSTNPMCAFDCYSIAGPGLTEIDGFWIEGFVDYPDWGGPAYGIVLSGCGSMNVSRNVLVGNGVGIFANRSGSVSLQNNTLIGNGLGVDREDSINLQWMYNIVWDSTEGGFDGFCNDLLHLDAPGLNFSEDPQFCGPSEGNYFLQSDSPCAAGNSPWSEFGLIGALPVSCGVVRAESKTWGSIKEMYSE